MKILIFVFSCGYFIFTVNTLLSQELKNKQLGKISIFEEPKLEELEKWYEFDPYLGKAYEYVKNEKKQLYGNLNNPFLDSIFKKKFYKITYWTIYESAKAYRDSLYYKSSGRSEFKNITLWAQDKFPDFMMFRREYNRYLEKNRI